MKRLGNIFPEIEDIDSYAERYYAISTYLKNNNISLYKYPISYGMSLKTLEEVYGYPQPIKPFKHIIKDYYPIAWTEQGEIICIKNFETCPSIAVYGSKGTGKTLICHRMIEGFYWFFGYLTFIANDYQDEVIAWAGPCKSNEFLRRIEILREKPVPLPIFLLLPYSKRKLDVEKARTSKLKIVLPFDYLIENIEKFVDLGGSEKYFKNMNFSKCKNEFDVRRIIDEGTQTLDKTAKKQVMGKIKIILNLFFKDNMISFDSKAIEKLKLDNDRSTEMPVIQLLKTNVIPTLVTTTIENKEWFSSWWESIFIDIINKKQESNEFKEKRLLIFIDEINKIIGGKKKEGVIESLRASIAQGRMMNIAVLYAGHHPSEVDLKIRGNCKYMFCFNLVNNEDVLALRKDYNLGDEAKKIKELKTFEFIAKSKEEPFIVYDTKSNIISERSFVRGFVIPPKSHHLPETTKPDFFAKRELDKKGLATTNLARKIIATNKIILRNPKIKIISNNPKAFQMNILDVCRKKDTKWIDFDLETSTLIEGIDYRKAYFEKTITDSDTTIVDYSFLREREFLLYKKGKKYYLFKEYEQVKEGFFPFSEIPKDIYAIVYNPHFRQFKIWSEKSDQGWVNEIDEKYIE